MTMQRPTLSTDQLLERAQRVADGGVFWPADLNVNVTSDTVKRRLKQAGYAVPAGDGFWVLTRAGGNPYYDGVEPNGK